MQPEREEEEKEKEESGRVGDVADASPRYGATLFCRRLLGISTKGPSVSDVNDVTKAGHDRPRWSDSPLTRGIALGGTFASTVLNLTPIIADYTRCSVENAFARIHFRPGVFMPDNATFRSPEALVSCAHSITSTRRRNFRRWLA